MKIRKATEADFTRIMEIYAGARAFMAAHGNPRQWGVTNWPPEDLIHNDIRCGHSYVCEDDGGVIGVFFYLFGEDIEPTYRVIEGSGWEHDGAFGVVHRIAGDGSRPGIGAFCLNWACEQAGHLRIDTHPDNLVMQKLLTRLGFEQRGIIHVEEDDDPRFAYEK